MRNTNKQEYVTALQKAYSTLSQAANMIIAGHGSPKCSDGGWACSNDDVYNMFKKYISTAKDCGKSPGCFRQFTKDNFRYLNDFPNDWRWDNSNIPKMVFSDGMNFVVPSTDRNCTKAAWGYSQACSEIFVDINGEKKPNTLGRDIFLFVLKEKGLYPAGCDEAANWCNGGSSKTSAQGRGVGCACKVLKEGKMDY